MASIEEILMAKAMADARDRPDPAVAMGTGAALGSVGGMLMGRGVRGRMAGGLVGAILGGGLGAGVRNALVQDSAAGNMLAKIQSQPSLNGMDRNQLQSVLQDIYNQGGM